MERDQETDEQWKRIKHIKWIKKWLRYVPRRSNIHRYPILKYFSKSAKERAYLWSFHVTEVVPALYAGWVLTMMPVMSVQIAIACLLAFVFRANIMVLVLLQFISTPWTVPFLWAADYFVGDWIIKLLGTDEVQLILEGYKKIGFNQISDIWEHGEQGLRIFFTTTLGGIVLGMILGHISVVIYKRMMQSSHLKK